MLRFGGFGIRRARSTTLSKTGNCGVILVVSKTESLAVSDLFYTEEVCTLPRRKNRGGQGTRDKKDRAEKAQTKRKKKEERWRAKKLINQSSINI